MFASDRDGDFEIYLMDTDGSNVEQLTSNGDTDEYPCWSPDGEFIAFVSRRDGNAEIYRMRADGSAQTRITDNTVDDTWPSWGE